MTAQLVSPEAVALFLHEADAAGVESARELVCTLLREAGLPLWEDMEIEVFPGAGGTLLLARPADLVEEGYRFGDLESLLAAASVCPPEYPARLLYSGGAYVLLLRRPVGEQGPEMSEFCLEGALSAGLMAHLREHGRVLMAKDAVARLQKIFK